MSEPFIGEIRIFALNFAPLDWAFCNGQVMNITQNQALFAVLGNTFGGDGRNTFGLPNLRGCAPMQFGQGTGLSQRNLGQTGGAANVTLTAAQLPAHTHAINASSGSGNLQDPNNAIWATSGARNVRMYSATSSGQMSPAALSSTGGSQPHNNMMPYLPLNFCIALAGVFPVRP